MCCREIECIIQRLEEDNIATQCIILHPDYSSVCLNVWVLQAAYFNYRQHYGTRHVPTAINE